MLRIRFHRLFMFHVGRHCVPGYGLTSPLHLNIHFRIKYYQNLFIRLDQNLIVVNLLQTVGKVISKDTFHHDQLV